MPPERVKGNKLVMRGIDVDAQKTIGAARPEGDADEVRVFGPDDTMILVPDTHEPAFGIDGEGFGVTRSLCRETAAKIDFQIGLGGGQYFFFKLHVK